MNQFALACLMAASTLAIDLQQYDEDFVHPWASACEGEDCHLYGGDYFPEIEDFPTLEEALTSGHLVPIGDLDGEILAVKMGESCSLDGECCGAEGDCGDDEDSESVSSAGDYDYEIHSLAAEDVIHQVDLGFFEIDQANLAVEFADIQAAQKVQSAEIDQIIADANVEVEEHIVESVEAEEPLKFEDLETIYDNRTDEIAETNAEHDTEVAAISKDHAVAAVSNDDVHDSIVQDIIAAAEEGYDIGHVIDDAELPFEVITEDFMPAMPEKPIEEAAPEVDSEFAGFLSQVLTRLQDANVHEIEPVEVYESESEESVEEVVEESEESVYEESEESAEEEVVLSDLLYTAPVEVKVERPQRPNKDVRPNRPAREQYRPNRPARESYRPQRDGRPVREERPSYRPQRDARPVREAFEPARPIRDERPNRQSYSVERPNRPARESFTPTRPQRDARPKRVAREARSEYRPTQPEREVRDSYRPAKQERPEREARPSYRQERPERKSFTPNRPVREERPQREARPDYRQPRPEREARPSYRQERPEREARPSYKPERPQHSQPKRSTGSYGTVTSFAPWM